MVSVCCELRVTAALQGFQAREEEDTVEDSGSETESPNDDNEEVQGKIFSLHFARIEIL